MLILFTFGAIYATNVVNITVPHAVLNPQHAGFSFWSGLAQVYPCEVGAVTF